MNKTLGFPWGYKGASISHLSPVSTGRGGQTARDGSQASSSQVMSR